MKHGQAASGWLAFDCNTFFYENKKWALNYILFEVSLTRDSEQLKYYNGFFLNFSYWFPK